MAMALLLALLIPVAQDDPQVTYREGLFEEVDQGNLEKAAELYAKVLKSGAPETLKAKALLRTGFCHEKKGRKKEAEQAWRDVIERFPGAPETVTLARERLARLENGGTQTIDAQVQYSILDLGQSDEKERNEAIRKLVLIGDATVPEMKKALQHRDRSLSLGAARVLIELERWDGVYETYRRHFPTIPLVDVWSLGQLLKGHEPSRSQFLKDAKLYMGGNVVGRLAQTLCALGDPEFKRLVADWFVAVNFEAAGSGLWDEAFRSWRASVGDVEIAGLIDRLAGQGDSTWKVQKVVLWINRDKNGPETQRAVVNALKRHPNPASMMGESYSNLFPYSRIPQTEEVFRGPIADWLSKSDDDFRSKALSAILSVARHQDQFADQDKARDLLFDLLVSPKLPLKVREVGITNAPWGGKDVSPYLDRYVALCLECLRAYRAEPSKPSVETLKTQKPSYAHQAISSLCYYLAPDSKDLPEVLDAVFDFPELGGESLIAQRVQIIKEPLMSAAVRAVQRRAKAGDLAVRLVQSHGSPDQQTLLGSAAAGWQDVKSGYELANTYVKGLSRLPKDREEAAWKAFQESYEASPEYMKVALARTVAGIDHPQGAAFMKRALDSDVAEVRNSAIYYWKNSESAEAIPLLIRALKDKSDVNQSVAINALGELRALDAVPELIRFLEGPDAGLRNNASEALKLIRQHFEERTQWQRWYEETKKALGK